MAQPSTSKPKVPAADDLYTIMLIVAAVLLLSGIIFLAVRSVQLFGSLLPPAGG